MAIGMNSSPAKHMMISRVAALVGCAELARDAVLESIVLGPIAEAALETDVTSTALIVDRVVDGPAHTSSCVVAFICGTRMWW
jgi:hypothetical protein